LHRREVAGEGNARIFEKEWPEEKRNVVAWACGREERKILPSLLLWHVAPSPPCHTGFIEAGPTSPLPDFVGFG
jgi:hypothetical protein